MLCEPEKFRCHPQILVSKFSDISLGFVVYESSSRPSDGWGTLVFHPACTYLRTAERGHETRLSPQRGLRCRKASVCTMSVRSNRRATWSAVTVSAAEGTLSDDDCLCGRPYPCKGVGSDQWDRKGTDGSLDPKYWCPTEGSGVVRFSLLVGGLLTQGICRSETVGPISPVYLFYFWVTRCVIQGRCTLFSCEDTSEQGQKDHRPSSYRHPLPKQVVSLERQDTL